MIFSVLTLIIFAIFIIAVCIFEFILKWRWFKYFLATLGLIASAVLFFISFYGGGTSQAEIAISLFVATLGEYIFALIISLVAWMRRLSAKKND
ncbi:hypothetical protein PWEIH_11003 [Listeria weihenstephanensis FSL R9-0317]|uniref:Membrane protein n=1 Tax=Listeria weihenstephanensis TaxID=1006155 RepID=A0A1S7FVP7_9LIST|nr:hypothetical protein [Listeria weihenstephanensis]AQY51405.1 membrane protein [Listeria weihenstephanensis]EUJ37211.1 hypothetical protein PWEIH_11003 [Listeria weihenstephanensis FSL R9-0317]MBC1500800.1 hypothetical protein [Listeria weihenstephanensis]